MTGKDEVTGASKGTLVDPLQPPAKRAQQRPFLAHIWHDSGTQSKDLNRKPLLTWPFTVHTSVLRTVS